MGDCNIYRLPRENTINLLVLRNAENQLRDAESVCNEITQEIQRRERWLDSNPWDHPRRDQALNNISLLRTTLNSYSIDTQTLRQDVQLRHYNLYHYASNLRWNFPYCFRCETVQEIDAVHILMTGIVVWPDGYVFRIGIRRSGVHPPPPVPFDDLFDHARRLNFEVVTLPALTFDV